MSFVPPPTSPPPPVAPTLSSVEDSAIRPTLLVSMAFAAVYAAVGVFEVILAVLLRPRPGAWRVLFEEHSRAAVERVAAIDEQIASVGRWGWALAAITLLVGAIWVYGLTKNAQRRGVSDTRPKYFGLLWLIPVFGPVFGIKELGRLVRVFGSSSRHLTAWLYLMYMNAVLWIATSFFVRSGFEQNPSQADSLAPFDRELTVRYVTAAFTVLVVAVGIRAILHTDRVISRARGTGATSTR